MEVVTIKKVMAKVLIGLVIFLVIVSVFKGTVTQILFTQAVRKMTGVSLKIRGLHLALFKGIIKINGLQLLNPKGFPEKILADIPELYVDLDIGALLQGRIHLEQVILNLNELIILRSVEGQLNLSSLKPVQESPTETKKSVEKQKKKNAFKLDYLRLSIGKAYYRDYRLGNPPPSREFPIEIQGAEYHDIQDPGELVRQILAVALARTVFAELGDLQGIQRRLEKNLEKARASVDRTTQKVIEETTEALNVLQFLKKEEPQPKSQK